MKASWQTEVDVVTKNMEDLHQEQLREQIKVTVLYEYMPSPCQFSLTGDAKLQQSQQSVEDATSINA